MNNSYNNTSIYDVILIRVAINVILENNKHNLDS